MEEIENKVEMSAVDEKSIVQQTKDLVNSMVGMVHELSEEGIFPKLPDDDMYKIDGNAHTKIDKTDAAAKQAHARYKKNKNMPELSWYQFVSKIKQKNQKEENQREIINDLITAVENNADASKLLFNHIIHLSTYSRKLLALGLEGIACNRIVVREVRARLKEASEEEIDQLAQQELLLVLDELEKQNALEIKIDKAIDDITLKVDKNELIELQEQFKESTQNYSEKLAQLRENVTQIQTNLNEKANAEEFKELQEQFKESAQNQVKLNEKLNQKADATIVDDKLKKLWIAYGITTAVLLTGLIASFLL